MSFKDDSQILRIVFELTMFNLNDNDDENQP